MTPEEKARAEEIKSRPGFKEAVRALVIFAVFCWFVGCIMGLILARLTW